LQLRLPDRADGGSGRGGRPSRAVPLRGDRRRRHQLDGLLARCRAERPGGRADPRLPESIAPRGRGGAVRVVAPLPSPPAGRAGRAGPDQRVPSRALAARQRVRPGAPDQALDQLPGSRVLAAAGSGARDRAPTLARLPQGDRGTFDLSRSRAPLAAPASLRELDSNFGPPPEAASTGRGPLNDFVTASGNVVVYSAARAPKARTLTHHLSATPRPGHLSLTTHPAGTMTAWRSLRTAGLLPGPGRAGER